MPPINANIPIDREGVFYQVKDDDKQPLSVKDVDTQKRTVEMVLNTYNFLDSQGDVLLPGCCKRSIKEHGPASSAPDKIKHALFHNLTRLPGKMIELSEGEYTWAGKKYFGLLGSSKLSHSTEGNDTLIGYQEEIYDNHSIGFRYIDYEYVERDAKGWKKVIDNLINPQDAEGRDYIIAVKEIELFEGSTVSFGANELTPALGVKSKDAVAVSFEKRMDQLLSYQRKINAALKNGEQSDEMMRTFELQALQMKQVMRNLFAQFPEIKKIVDKKPDEEKAVLIDYAYLCQEIKL